MSRTGRTVCIVLAALLTAGSVTVWLHTRATRRTRAAVPVSTRFRNYMAESGMHLVVYSPPADASDAAIHAALTLLRTRFDGLVLYGTTTQTVRIVQEARALGYRGVMLTVWDPRSEAELAIAASLVRDNASHIAMAVTLGSEGLMEHRYTIDDLTAARAELLDRNTDPASVEMTTTEPWWLLKRPDQAKLRSFGDFTSTNVHVVWDTGINMPALAASWTADRVREVEAAAGRPVLLRESGYPGGGVSPREGSTLAFTRTMQAGYWTAWQALPSRPPAAVFEGVDNPEKHWRGFEGEWGLLGTSATGTDLRPWPAWNAFAPQR